MIRISDLNWEIVETIYLIIIFIVGFVITTIIIPPIIKIMKKKGYIGIDIHKTSKTEVAESGGIAIIFGISCTSVLLIIFFPSFFNEIIIFILTVILSGVIGYIDDRIRLKSRYKVLLTIFTGILIFLANTIGFISIESPTIPFLGKLRLSFIYPIIVPIIVAVFANTVNMLEGYNGEGSGTSIIALISLLVCSIIWDSAEGMLFTVISLAVLIPFYLYNKFPAKIFPGDVGTLSIGAIFAGIALFGSLEAAVFCALLIHIFNSFYVLYSVKGFFESSEILDNKSDIILLENDTIKASDLKSAALTLPRLILAKGPLKEPELVKRIFIISIICGFFSIITTILMVMTIGNINYTSIIIVTVIFGFITAIILYKFPRVRGIVILMVILIVIGYVYLVCIDLFIMPLNIVDLNILGLIIPTNILISLILVIPGLLVWYYITIKFFWFEINKMKNSFQGNNNDSKLTN
jgi:UDP-N-acetylmuramyl pentapeptide phosphotransferase/UDP-N-acetylglucosamine-1-phosphate transferase